MSQCLKFLVPPRPDVNCSDDSPAAEEHNIRNEFERTGLQPILENVRIPDDLMTHHNLYAGW